MWVIINKNIESNSQTYRMDTHLVQITDLVKDYAKIIDELREKNELLKKSNQTFLIVIDEKNKSITELSEKNDVLKGTQDTLLQDSKNYRETIDELREEIRQLKDKKTQLNASNFWKQQFDLRQENKILRQALSDIAANLGNGSTVSVDASLPFIKELPHEVKLVCDGLRKAFLAEQKTCNTLREELNYPPADVQEKVLDMLGVNKRIIDLIERYNELRREVELFLKGHATSFGQILQKHDAHKN